MNEPVTMAGCPGKPEITEPLLTRESFPLTYWNTICKHIHEKCCKGKAIEDLFQDRFGETMKVCEGNFERTFAGYNPKEYFDTLVKDGNVTFHLDKAKSCIETLSSISCSNIDFTEFHDCSVVYEGGGREDDACRRSSDCDFNHFCAVYSSKKCKKASAVAESCAGGRDTFQACSRGSNTFCSGQICRNYLKEGDSCGEEPFIPCGFGLSCLEGKCAPPSATELCK